MAIVCCRRLQLMVCLPLFLRDHQHTGANKRAAYFKVVQHVMGIHSAEAREILVTIWILVSQYSNAVSYKQQIFLTDLQKKKQHQMHIMGRKKRKKAFSWKWSDSLGACIYQTNWQVGSEFIQVDSGHMLSLDQFG